MIPGAPPPPGGSAGGRRGRAETAVLYLLSIGATLLISGGLVAVTGNSWTQVLGALLNGAFLAPGRWGNTLVVATPMLLVALGMVIGVKSGVFNIGQEGQLLMGAMAMAYVGTKLAGPGPLLLTGGLILGALTGGLFAALAAVMRYRRGVPEVISTLLLVFIAFQINGFAITTDWFLRDLDPNRPSRAVTSAQLPDEARLPVIALFGNEVHLGWLFALAAAGAAAFLMTRTSVGFKLRLLGANPGAAQTVGVAVARWGSAALFASGALAGFAGAVMLAGGASSARLTSGFASNFGWQGLLVALLAGSRPLVCIPMAVVFAGLRTGSGFLAATGVDRKIVDVIQALLVLALLIPPAVQFIRDRRRAAAGAAVGQGAG